MKDVLNICMVYPIKNAYSETFIKNQIERLPFNVKSLYGGWFPTYKDGDVPLTPLLLQKIDYLRERYLDLSGNCFRNKAFISYLKGNKIDVVLAQYGLTGIEIMDLCCQGNFPLVVHFHGFDSSQHQVLSKYKTQYIRMFEVASAIISVSTEMTQKLINIGAPADKIYCIPCGADTKLFTETDPSQNAPIFVSVGRFVDKKAPHLTILAFNNVVGVCKNAKLIMAGDGELYGPCHSLVKALNLTSNIEFLGSCTHEQVVKLMQSARAFVQHSVTAFDGDSEGTPVAVLEASSIGLPVVGTKHAGIKDVVVHGETGFLVDEYDVNSMAEYMIKLANEPELAKRLGLNGMNIVRADYSLEISIRKLSEVLLAVSKPGSGRHRI